MKFSFKWNIRTTVGALIGLISPMLIVPVTILLISYLQNFQYQQLWHNFLDNATTQSKFLSLSIIANLFWFYFFLNKERWDLARGVIIGSALYLPYIIYVTLIR